MSHPFFARLYSKRSEAQADLQADHRRELLAGLSGHVLEVGCGNGLNFAYYPAEVTEVVGIEPEPYLRHRAESAPRNVPVRVVAGRAEALSEVVEGQFDAVVFSLVLCSVSDPRAVLRESRKVLRPGAALRLYEHVVSEDPTLARWQRLAAPLWSRVAGGCQPNRDTLASLGQDFVLTHSKHFDFCPGPRVPLGIVAPHIQAQAIYHPT